MRLLRKSRDVEVIHVTHVESHICINVVTYRLRDRYTLHIAHCIVLRDSSPASVPRATTHIAHCIVLRDISHAIVSHLFQF